MGSGGQGFIGQEFHQSQWIHAVGLGVPEQSFDQPAPSLHLHLNPKP